MILWVSEKAGHAGVIPGLRYAAGCSLAPNLRVGVVPSAEIEKGVAALTERFMRFTPDVEPAEEPGIFWLGGSGLSLLYPSLKEWAHSVRDNIEGAGFHGSVVVGFTRFGTYAVAKAQKERVVFEDFPQERAAAREVTLDRLDLEPDLRDTLFKLGIKTVGAFLSLPAGGLYERFGPKAYRLHRMASGDLWTPLQPRPVEEPIRQTLILDDPETDTTRLLFLIKRLLQPMLAVLAARGEALAELTLRFLIDRSGWHRECIRPAAPTLDSLQVLDLIRLRLETIEFSAGVVEIELIAGAVPATSEQLRLFAEKPKRDLDAANRALARLRAEFGDEAVVRAKLTDGHLPEARFVWEPLSRVALPRDDLNGLNDLNVLNCPTAKVLVRRILAKPIPLPSQPRTRDDGWLLLGPKYGAVEKLSGPYVVSGGWWVREIHREYYFAETHRGDLLWVYYDRPRRRWFLQGWVE
jgi:protein ImuB